MNLKLSNTNKILLGIATVIIVGALITFYYVSSHTSHVAEGEYYLYGTIKTDEPRTLDFSGVRGFLVTNVCIVQRSAA